MGDCDQGSQHPAGLIASWFGDRPKAQIDFLNSTPKEMVSKGGFDVLGIDGLFVIKSIAVDETYYGLAIHLIELGADPNISDNERDSPLDIAKYFYVNADRKLTIRGAILDRRQHSG